MPFMPPISWLRERFYLCEAGVLRHNKTIGKSIKHAPAGRKLSDGYCWVDVMHNGKRKKLAVHRVVWSLHNGRAVPDDREVDHGDWKTDNNHPSNLKARTVRANQLNKQKKGTGVSVLGDGRFRSRIKVHGIDIDLGTHDSWDAANREYRMALRGKHPKVTRDVLRGIPYQQLMVE